MKRAALLFFCGLPLAASAQTPAQNPPPPAGITATGQGVASAVVTTALVRIVAAGVPDDSLVETLRAVGVDTLVADRGRPRAGGIALLTVRGRVADATQARVDAVATAVRRYGQGHAAASITDVRFYGPAADCPAIEQRAREAALADARRRASAIAAMSSTPLGAQVAVAETGGCPRVGPSGGAFAIDVGTMSMRVTVEETVTFATPK